MNLCKMTVALLALAPLSAYGQSPASAGYLPIADLWNNWNSDSIAVTPPATPINLGSCGVGSPYVTAPGNSGNHLMKSLLTSAYLAGRKVSLVISGCSNGLPAISIANISPT